MRNDQTKRSSSTTFQMDEFIQTHFERGYAYKGILVLLKPDMEVDMLSHVIEFLLCACVPEGESTMLITRQYDNDNATLRCRYRDSTIMTARQYDNTNATVI